MAKSGWKKRMEQTEIEIANARGIDLKPKGGTISFWDASLCHDLANDMFTFSWTEFKIAKGDMTIKDFLSKSELEKCKKNEATCLLRVGDKDPDTGAWICGKYKNIWLRGVGLYN